MSSDNMTKEGAAPEVSGEIEAVHNSSSSNGNGYVSSYKRSSVSAHSSNDNDLSYSKTNTNAFSSKPPRFVSKIVQLSNLSGPQVTRLRKQALDGDCLPLHRRLRSIPVKVLVLGFGLCFLLFTSFVHVILIQREHLEGHHLHPMSNVLRSASNGGSSMNFGQMLHLRPRYVAVKRRLESEDLPSILIQRGNFNHGLLGVGGVDGSEQKYHRLIRRIINEQTPKDGSFPVVKFQPMVYVPDDEPKHGNGGLKINRVKNFETGRVVKEDKNAMSGHIWVRENMDDAEKSKYVDSYYAFDDDIVRSRHFHNEDCKRTSWHKYYFPTCNNFHEMDLMHDSSKKLGGGYYRTVWASWDALGNNYVMKGSKYKHPGESCYSNCLGVIPRVHCVEFN